MNMDRSFSLTDEEFSRIWMLASALYGKGKSLEESLKEATRAYTLELPELMRQPGGLRIARQGEAEMRLTPRKGDPRAYTLMISTPGDAEEPPRKSAEPILREKSKVEPVERPEPVEKSTPHGFHLTLIRGERE